MYVRVNVWIVRRDKKVAFVEVAVSGGWIIEACPAAMFHGRNNENILHKKYLFPIGKKFIVPATWLPCKTSVALLIIKSFENVY